MRFVVLGPVEAWDGGQRLALGGPQQRALLAALLLNADQVMSADRLMDYLWGERPPAAARGLLQGCVAGLRRVLRTAAGDQPLVTRAPGYLLRVAPGELDLDRFEELARLAGAEADPERAAGYLSEALSLWRGRALDGVAVPGCRADVARLEERRLTVLEQRIELDLRLGRFAELVGELQVHTAAQPLRERLWAQLMLALFKAQRRADALEAYRRLRQTLVDQLGLEPGATAQRLHRAILVGGDALAAYFEAGRPGAVAQATELAGPVVPAQLPAAPAAFAGRTRYIKRLDELLSEPTEGLRIAVISGMAGIGKTSLAVHWAHRARDRFPDGQLYVNLNGFDPLRAPLKPADAIRGFLDALQVSPQRVPVSLEAQAGLYRSLLADRKMLVVLDNARDAEQVRPLLPGAADCLVVMTSRSQISGLMAAGGADLVELDLLSPDEAWQLLARRLGTERLAAEPDATEEIITGCARLPLALAVVAGRAATRPHFPLGALADELHDARTGLDALSDPDPAVDLRAALDVSYHILSPEAARLYRLLGLHAGPDIDLYAAAALADTTVDRVRRPLNELHDAHLLQEPAPARYVLHDLIRVHAVDAGATSETEADRRAALARLLDHYRQVALLATDIAYPYDRERRPHLPPADAHSPDLTAAGKAMGWLDAELPNLLAAARQAADDGWPEHTRHLSTILHRHLRTRGRYHDAETLHRQALTTAQATSHGTAELEALNCLGYVHRLQGRHEQALDYFGQALEIARATGDRTGELDALNGLGYVHLQQGRNEPAFGHLGQALVIARATGFRTGELSALLGLGHVQRLLGRYERALDDFGQALAIARATGDRAGELNALRGLGYIHRLLGQYERALDDFGQALEIARTTGNRGGELSALTSLGDVYRGLRRHEQATDRYQRALELARELDDRNWQFEALHGLGRLYHATGRPEEAVANHRQGLELAAELVQPTDQARAHDGLAHAYRALSDREQARQHWQHALAILTRLGTGETEDGESSVSVIRAQLASLDE